MQKLNGRGFQQFFALSVITVSLTACVSVKIGDNEVKRAEEVKYTEPSEPFEKFDAEHVDAAWTNPKNGNALSFLSDCNESGNLPLMHIRKGVVKGIERLKVTRSEEKTYNKRQALYSEVSGHVDGVPSRLSLMIFRKNNCLYILTYVGLQEVFETDKIIFHNFLKEFKAP